MGLLALFFFLNMNERLLWSPYRRSLLLFLFLNWNVHPFFRVRWNNNLSLNDIWNNSLFFNVIWNSSLFFGNRTPNGVSTNRTAIGFSSSCPPGFYCSDPLSLTCGPLYPQVGFQNSNLLSEPGYSSQQPLLSLP